MKVFYLFLIGLGLTLMQEAESGWSIFGIIVCAMLIVYGRCLTRRP